MPRSSFQRLAGLLVALLALMASPARGQVLEAACVELACSCAAHLFTDPDVQQALGPSVGFGIAVLPTGLSLLSQAALFHHGPVQLEGGVLTSLSPLGLAPLPFLASLRFVPIRFGWDGGESRLGEPARLGTLLGVRAGVATNFAEWRGHVGADVEFVTPTGLGLFVRTGVDVGQRAGELVIGAAFVALGLLFVSPLAYEQSSFETR